MTASKLEPLGLLRAVFTVLVVSGVEASYTKAFYELMQRQPLMTYECYASGATAEPENAVNLAGIWDGTRPKDNKVVGTRWYEIRGQFDSYTIGEFTTEYNKTAGVGIFVSGDVRENIEIVLPPYNGEAYYMKITITSQRNRVVYKIYDTSARCQNAAALFFKTCYDNDCGYCNKGCKKNGVPLSKSRRILDCHKMRYTRYPQAEPFPLCAEYRSCF